MIILFDIGNTAVTYGLYYGGRMHATGSKLINEIPDFVNNSAKSGNFSSINVIISSVVPKNTEFIRKSLLRMKGLSLWIAGENFPIRIDSKYKYSNKLGIDRKINIYGASKIYRPPVLLIDIGTAITVDYVSPSGVFEGGMIIPGPQISFQAMMDKAALLPKKLLFPLKTTGLIGKTTEDCMNCGILEGFGAMLNGLVDKFRLKYGSEIRAVATGGYASTLKPYTSKIDILAPLLSINSLFILYKNHTRKKT
jgi:type III pantothenate kinase